MITGKKLFTSQLRVDSARNILTSFLSLAVGFAFCIPGAACQSKQNSKAKLDQTVESQNDSLSFFGESRIHNVRQLTFGGQNAEAYFSEDNSQLIFQSTPRDSSCDAIYMMKSDGSELRMVSSGEGVTTCPFIAPDNKRIIYSSTHLSGSECPPRPDHSQGYVWALYEEYEIFSAKPDGSDIVQLTNSPGYDAEGVYSPQGDKIIFTSVRDGDIELYTMNPDGSDQTRITDVPGYDGGAFFSADGSKIVWRASRPTGEDLEEYQNLLAQGLIKPGKLEIFMANSDGTNISQLTENGAANFCPYFHPSGEFVIFSSNMNDPR
ncbi:MAG: PD40 domain-containing protein, partial [candidate division Zixibacteria bacterium]|nr:PD40 domain-containing protein [candidate division Zixibacteria bacterium]